jgi:hypothetical protein
MTRIKFSMKRTLSYSAGDFQQSRDPVLLGAQNQNEA